VTWLASTVISRHCSTTQIISSCANVNDTTKRVLKEAAVINFTTIIFDKTKKIKKKCLFCYPVFGPRFETGIFLAQIKIYETD
jgi:biotin synthase-like enzyme